MGKIKIKDIEGDQEDIQALFREGDCNLSSYIGAEAFRKKVPDKWTFLITTILFVLSCSVWTDAFNPVWTKVAQMAILFLGVFMVWIVHSNYRSPTLTMIVIFALSINFLLILNVYSPQEIAKRIEQMALEEYKRKKS